MRRKEAIDAFDRITKAGPTFLMEQWIYAGKAFEKCDIVKPTDAVVLHAIKGDSEKLNEYRMCCNMRENPVRNISNFYEHFCHQAIQIYVE